MKKKFTFLLAAVMLLMMVLPMKGWADTASFSCSDFSGQGSSGSGGDLSGATIGDITITGKGYGNATYLQVYANNYLIFTPNNGATITKIVLTATSGYIKTWSASDNTTVTISGSTATWSGSSTSAITLTNTATAQARLTAIEVTYSPGVAHTVTLDDTGETLTETSVGAGVTLPSRPDGSPYTFAGWSETNITEETTTVTIIPAGVYHPTQDITLYPLYSRPGGSTTTWTLVENFGNISEGVYAILSDEKKAFNGSISSGHGQSTNAFVFGSDNVATSVPEGICEITMEPVMSGNTVLGYKMHNEELGYLYVNGTSSGNLVWAQESTEWKNSYSINWICSYNNNIVFLRSFTSNQGVTSFRTYSNAANKRLYFARKGTVTTTYYISVLPTLTPSITASDVNIDYNATSGSIEYSISNGVEGGALTAPIASSTIADLTISSISNTTVSFTCSGNTSFSPHTATITLTYTYPTDQIVTKDITITQGPSPSYTVTYKANEGTGNDLVDAGYASGVYVTVKANEGTGNPNFTRTGHTFSNWNTVAGGGGTSYSAGNTFLISSDINLFARWTKKNYNVAVSSIEGVTLTATYDANTITEGNNANVPYGTAVTLAVTGLGEGQSFEWSITKTDGGDDVTEEVLDGTTITIPDYAVTIGGTVVSTYTVTYDCNGATSGCPENVSGIVSGTSITLAAAPTKTGNSFTGWSDGANTYDAGAAYTVNSAVTFTAQWAVGATGLITFGSADGSVKINAASVAANDNQGNEWTITTVGTTSFTQNSAYSQVGSGSSHGKSLTFEMTLPTPSDGHAHKIVEFEAKFGGFNGDVGNISLIVGETTVKTGSLDGANDVIVKDNPNITGNTLKITVTRSDFLRVKCYYIKYSYIDIDLTPVTITFNGHGGSYNSSGTYTQEVYSGIQATLNANQFVKENSGFTNWSTEENGGGDTYFDGANITVDAATTLYAQWATSYTASVANNIEGGTVKIVVDEEEVTSYSALEGTKITLTYSTNLGYRFSAWNVKDADNNTVTVTDNKFDMPAKNVTISATFVEAVFYELVTSNSQLVSGKHYIIANGTNSYSSAVTVQAMSTQNSNNRSKVDVSVSNNTIVEDPNIAMCEFVINGPFTVNNASTYTIFDPENGTNGGYLYAAGSSDNRYLRTEEPMDDNNNCRWSISITANTYKATITAQGTNTNNRLLNNTGNVIFSCYSGTSQQVDNNVYLYVKHDDNALVSYSESVLSTEVSCATYTFGNASGKLTITNNGVLNCSGTITGATTSNLIVEDGGQLITSSAVNATVKKDIAAWDTGLTNGWYFISSPINASLIPSNVANMLTDENEVEEERTYDLYSYDADHTVDEVSKSWVNYRAHSGEFTVENGMGYLYASKEGTTLGFSGEILPSNSSKTVDLKANKFNLVGNPYTCAAYINQPYFTLSQVKDGVSSTTVATLSLTPISPCTGVVVKPEGTSVKFSKDYPVPSANSGDLQMVLAQNVTTRGESRSRTLDNAIVSFNEGSQLGKFYFGTQDANLYIPMDNEEYAIVSSSAQGEMPINFKAHRDGQYTITVNPQEVEMGYMHLIDNIAGVEVDLLANPSYTFNARYDDYESRFRLVFSANMVNADLNDDFAFFSNGQLVIANEGEAILQVIDVNGRVVATESVNGTCSKAINAKAGVYVLRLINGTDVKTQKIIVK